MIPPLHPYDQSCLISMGCGCDGRSTSFFRQVEPPASSIISVSMSTILQQGCQHSRSAREKSSNVISFLLMEVFAYSVEFSGGYDFLWYVPNLNFSFIYLLPKVNIKGHLWKPSPDGP